MAGIISASVGVIVAFGLPKVTWWMLLGSVVFSFVGMLVAVRAWIAEVAIARDRVRVRGLLYSRTIMRKQIVGVDRDLRDPSITWKSTRSLTIVTPLSVLSIGRTILRVSWFPRSSSFLARLASWAG